MCRPWAAAGLSGHRDDLARRPDRRRPRADRDTFVATLARDGFQESVEGLASYVLATADAGDLQAVPVDPAAMPVSDRLDGDWPTTKADRQFRRNLNQRD